MKPAEILSEARALLDDAIQLRRRIHRHPEIGLTLPRTQASVLEALDGLGLETRAGQRTTSVIARLTGGKQGPTILLRADMDALPLREETGLPFASEVDGAMHACGHDAHVAMLVGAARVLARRRADLAGSVLFMFQPGEEGYHGARVMLEEGLLDGGGAPSGAFALHVTHRGAAGVITTRPGPMLASGDTIKITAGTTRNVIPETAHLLGTVRTVSELTRERVLEGVRRVADGIATAHGAEAAVELIRGYPVTSNDPGFAGFVLDTAREALGAERVTPMRHPVMGSEDFSYVLQRVPGAMANLGTRPESGDVYPNHSNRMLVNEAALASGIAMHAAVALRFFERCGAIVTAG